MPEKKRGRQKTGARPRHINKHRPVASYQGFLLAPDAALRDLEADHQAQCVERPRLGRGEVAQAVDTGADGRVDFSVAVQGVRRGERVFSSAVWRPGTHAAPISA